MKTSVILSVFLFFLILLNLSCKKEGVGGKSDLSVFVKHHENLIPNAVVYIKYGATEFPGHESQNYDNSAICGSEGHEAGHTDFKGLKKGFYYLYSVGWDSTIQMAVSGGIPIVINQKAGEMTVDIPVVEEH